LFTKFRIVSLKETILGGNQWLSENSKLTWMTENNRSTDRDRPTQTETNIKLVLDPKHIMLTPMQIRTFVAEITQYPA
jgi:hypothetical protein